MVAGIVLLIAGLIGDGNCTDAIESGRECSGFSKSAGTLELIGGLALVVGLILGLVGRRD